MILLFSLDQNRVEYSMKSVDKKKWTWAEELVAVLELMGGEGQLQDIKKLVAKRGKKKINNESSIRQTLEMHCPEKQGTGRPLFVHIGSERSGIYRLKDRFLNNSTIGKSNVVPQKSGDVNI